jgi:hypothetical protein
VEGVLIISIIIDFSKAFDFVPNDRLLKKLLASGVDSRVVVWVREFLVGRKKSVNVRGQLFKEVKVKSGVRQGSVYWNTILSTVWKRYLEEWTRVLEYSLTTV